MPPVVLTVEMIDNASDDVRRLNQNLNQLDTNLKDTSSGAQGAG